MIGVWIVGPNHSAFQAPLKVLHSFQRDVPKGMCSALVMPYCLSYQWHRKLRWFWFCIRFKKCKMNILCLPTYNIYISFFLFCFPLPFKIFLINKNIFTNRSWEDFISWHIYLYLFISKSSTPYLAGFQVS